MRTKAVFDGENYYINNAHTLVNSFEYQILQTFNIEFFIFQLILFHKSQ